MRIVINGEQQERSAGISLTCLLAEMSLEPQRVAIERNKLIVPRANYAETFLADGDVLEIVTLVGGG